MKARTNTTAKTPQNSEAYNTRMAIVTACYTDKSGELIQYPMLISFGNYFYVNQSKSGKIYGRMMLTGVYNLKQIAKALEVDERDMEPTGEWATLFFSDRDAEYLKGSVDQSLKRPFHGRLALKENNEGAAIVINVDRLD